MEDVAATDKEQESSASSEAREAVPFLQEFKGWVRDVLFAALTAILLVVFVVQPVKVEGTSMQPRLSDQERIFVNKFVYRISDIERGDVVVFWYPRDRGKSFIKRIVGLPGERVEIREGVVYIDGRALDEPYVPDDFRDAMSIPTKVIAPNSYFVLGDHRNSSNDSRHWGTVPVENICGKALLRYWPVSKFGLVK